MRKFRFFRELPDNPFRMGRHQAHDWLDEMPETDVDVRGLGWLEQKITKPITVTHAEIVPCFDQGQIGDCTANAGLGTLVTAPYAQSLTAEKLSHAFTHSSLPDEQDAVEVYEIETKIDDSQIPGEYPPDDTGSTGPWSMIALQQLGLVSSFVHSRSAHNSLVLLNTGPISIGVPWFKSMFNVDSQGNIVFDPESGVAGGHQVAIVANDTDNRRITIRNSWGEGWGQDGHAFLSYKGFDYLFNHGADTVQPRT